MKFEQNVPKWERGIRAVFGLGLIGLGVYLFTISSIFWAIMSLGSGVILEITVLSGWCPICAMAGRKLPKSDRTLKIERV